jgi:hypothetical protein
MGGFGSGRYDYADTPTVEECRHLDVDRIKEFTERPGSPGSVYWGGQEDPAATIAVVGEDPQEIAGDRRATTLRLTYTLAPDSEDPTECDYPVPLDYTECNFGGVRPWFRCPGVVEGDPCGRRCRKLYLPRRSWAEYFLCRECYDLGYTSSRTSGDEMKQAELRYRRAFKKADAENRRPHPENMPYTPERPKGMHQDTFEDLTDDVQAARREWERAMKQRTREIIATHRELLDDLDSSTAP